MADVEQNVWGIHAGRFGDAHNLFMNKKLIAIGWPEVGNLGPLSPDRESFKAKVSATYPDLKAGAIPNNAGQLYRFVHEMKVGDLVIYPSKSDRQIHIGKISGGYQHDPAGGPEYPNRRSVTWLKSFPRTHFKQGALYEIGSALSLFQVRTYVEEFLAALALEGAVAPAPVEDETISYVAEEIEEITRDFILKRFAHELKGHPFAHFVAHLLGAMGYRTRVAPAGPDGGVDIVAHKDELGFEPPIIKVQVKSSAGSIGNGQVAELNGNVGQGEHGLFVTLGTYTNQAKTFAKGRSNLRLIDGEELVSLVLQHYEQLDSRYKGLVPLKRVYIPEDVASE